MLAPVVIVVVAQATNPGSIGQLLLLLPAVAASMLRVLLPRFPAEAYAVAVVVPVAAVVGQDGASRAPSSSA